MEIQNGYHDVTYFNIEPYGNFTFFVFFLETGVRISTSLGRNGRQVVLYHSYEIGADPKINMAARINYVF